ncbi:hypothetical protein PC111_g14871 [Phytophthora cactorum]|nr:hypothetical protein PC111_g14871 [Phytophthora cactorum]KAG3015275.1 hypothetical protein PC120_g12236 [Phytophthora cactorum]
MFVIISFAISTSDTAEIYLKDAHNIYPLMVVERLRHQKSRERSRNILSAVQILRNLWREAQVVADRASAGDTAPHLSPATCKTSD